MEVGTIPDIFLQSPNNSSFGDLSSNAAMVLAAQAKKPPRRVAQMILDHLELGYNQIDHVEIAGPGFINFFLANGWWYQVLEEIYRAREDYGRQDLGKGEKIQVEFVSANPTGPLHIGHGRGAAVGDVLANILDAVGYRVQREYYINDAGTQMDILGKSVLLRYQELLGEGSAFPDNAYQGDYIVDIARELLEQKNEGKISWLEKDSLPFFTRYAKDRILDGIREDLQRFGVKFDQWFSEKNLYDSGDVEQTLRFLALQGLIKLREGAAWFLSSRFGDDKDRVIIRQSGDPTYLASDIAYHRNKYQRGFTKVIDIWGADHHGYVERMKAAVQALDHPKASFQVLLVQLVSLVRGGQPVAMSTRAGEFTTLAEVMEEVGTDAARFFLLTRTSDSHLEFDLDLAKQQSAENPVYYVQYAHARISSIFRQAAHQGIAVPGASEVELTLLSLPEEIELIRKLSELPQLLAGAAMASEPHRLTAYTQNLAAMFHKYYHRHRVISDDKALTAARLILVYAIGAVLRNVLKLLGISAPEQM